MPYLTNLSPDTQTRTLQLLEAIAREIGLLPPLPLDPPEPPVPTVTKSIGTSGRDYSTMTAWEADLDNDTPYDAGDTTRGECYDDSVFDESVTINGGGTLGIATWILSVASGEMHDGTAGTGARNVRTAAGGITTARQDTINHELSLLEVNLNGNTGTAVTSASSNGNTKTYQRLLLHGGGNGTVDGLIVGFFSSSAGRGYIINDIVYDFNRTTAGATLLNGIAATSSGGLVFIYNSTVFDITRSSATGDVGGIVVANSSVFTVKNCAALDTGGDTSGAIKDFVFPGTSPDADWNLSSDTTADDALASPPGNCILSAASADQFVSTVGGSEDLHLKSGADCIDAGTDLGTTPTGVNIDIDGRDRDAEGDTWDIGADEFVAAPPGGAFFALKPPGGAAVPGAIWSLKP